VQSSAGEDHGGDVDGGDGCNGDDGGDGDGGGGGGGGGDDGKQGQDARAHKDLSAGGYLQVEELVWVGETLGRDGGFVTCFDVSPALLVVGMASGVILVADRETREVVQRLGPQNGVGMEEGGVGGGVLCVTICPSGHYIASAFVGAGGTGADLKIWDWRRNSLVRTHT
jgi:hypothetical protein